MIEIEINDREIRDALQQLQQRVENLRPALTDIGAAVTESTRLRFRDQETPAGAAWAPLSRFTVDRRRQQGRGAQILRDTGRLANSITYQVGSDYVEVGTNVVYGPTHQFGARRGEFGVQPVTVKAHQRRGRPVRQHTRQQALPWGNIPARPFLGLSDADEGEIVRILSDYLLNAE